MGNVYSGVKAVIKGPYPNRPGHFFTKEFYQKNYSVYPIMFLMVTDIIFATSNCIWNFCTKDITIDRSKKPINYRMDLLKPYYLRLIVQAGDDLRPLPELHQIYKDMKKADNEKKKQRS